MKAGAESGWDYSTRWMINNEGGNAGELKDIKTNLIIPVDLNSLMFMNYNSISEFYSVLGDTARADIYANKAKCGLKKISNQTGTDVMILEVFSPKNSAKNGVFDSK
jgi:alpha,alpha-trehalase